MTTNTVQQLPAHIGFIVDGNRRWARQHGLPAYEGHMAGYNVVKEVLRHAVNKGVQFVSFYVFSTENWKRTQDEVSRLMTMAITFSGKDIKDLVKEDIRVRILGRQEGLSPKVVKSLQKAEAQTRHCTRAQVVFCFNYGGQQEIADAAAACVADNAEITQENIRSNLYGADIPDIDIIVRSSGEQRLSNFMLWRAAYSELLFIDKLWPDLRPQDIDMVLQEYSKRQRRFGGN